MDAARATSRSRNPVHGSATDGFVADRIHRPRRRAADRQSGSCRVIADDVQARVASAITSSEVIASGDSKRMEVTVVSPAFDGVSRVRRQQLVYGAIADLIRDGALHAVTIRAYTPGEHPETR